MTTSTFVRPLSAALITLAGSTAHAQSLTLTERQTVLAGQFLVGFSTLIDSDAQSAHSVALEPSFDRTLESSGMVDGMVRNFPVFGTAGFRAAQSYDVDPDAITLHGEARAQAEAGFDYVSAGADADSSLSLIFSVAEATPFSMIGSLINGGTHAWASLSLRPVTAMSSSTWTFTSTGAFNAAGTLAPGSWRLYASADADAGPGDFRLSMFDARLQLLPVPEPHGALMLLCGAVVLGFLARRRREDH